MRLLLVIACVFAVGAAQAAPIFVPLGFLPGRPNSSQAAAISADGSTVVGEGLGPGGVEGFRWTSATGMTSVGADYQPAAVSADGSVVVGLHNQGTDFVIDPFGDVVEIVEIEAFRWTSGTGPVGLGKLPGGTPSDGAQFGSRATGVSADGSIVVGSSDSGDPFGFGVEAFRWTSGTGMTGLGSLPAVGTASSASGISADGSTVVGSGAASGHPSSVAIRWTAGGLERITFVPQASEATAVSTDGSVVVGWAALGGFQQAFYWTSASGTVGIGDLPGGSSGSFALATSADGSVIVGRSFSATGQEAFVWTAGTGMQELDQALADLGLALPAGWTLTSATGISADGQTIVGFGTNPSGKTEAWLVTIPEPGTALLLGGGIGVLSARRPRAA